MSVAEHAPSECGFAARLHARDVQSALQRALFNSQYIAARHDQRVNDREHQGRVVFEQCIDQNGKRIFCAGSDAVLLVRRNQIGEINLRIACNAAVPDRNALTIRQVICPVTGEVDAALNRLRKLIDQVLLHVRRISALILDRTRVLFRNIAGQVFAHRQREQALGAILKGDVDLQNLRQRGIHAGSIERYAQLRNEIRQLLGGAVIVQIQDLVSSKNIHLILLLEF